MKVAGMELNKNYDVTTVSAGINRKYGQAPIVGVFVSREKARFTISFLYKGKNKDFEDEKGLYLIEIYDINDTVKSIEDFINAYENGHRTALESHSFTGAINIIDGGFGIGQYADISN